MSASGDKSNWRALVGRPVTDRESAIEFVDTMGISTSGPVTGVDFPNLADALKTTAFDVWYSAWGWKDDLHFEKRLYYARIVCGQPTFVGRDCLPDLIAALGGRGHTIERDPERLYAAGRLSREARVMFDCLAEHPALSSRELRSRAGLSHGGPAAERALLELQRRFLICKVDLTGRTRGTYSYVWDLAERFWPEPFEEAARTAPNIARAALRARLTAFGVAPTPALEQRLFLWPRAPGVDSF